MDVLAERELRAGGHVREARLLTGLLAARRDLSIDAEIREHLAAA